MPGPSPLRRQRRPRRVTACRPADRPSGTVVSQPRAASDDGRSSWRRCRRQPPGPPRADLRRSNSISRSPPASHARPDRVSSDGLASSTDAACTEALKAPATVYARSSLRPRIAHASSRCESMATAPARASQAIHQRYGGSEVLATKSHGDGRGDGERDAQAQECLSQLARLACLASSCRLAGPGKTLAGGSPSPSPGKPSAPAPVVAGGGRSKRGSPFFFFFFLLLCL